MLNAWLMILEHGPGECLSGWFLSLVSGFNMRGGQPGQASDDAGDWGVFY